MKANRWLMRVFIKDRFGRARDLNHGFIRHQRIEQLGHHPPTGDLRFDLEMLHLPAIPFENVNWDLVRKLVSKITRYNEHLFS